MIPVAEALDKILSAFSRLPAEQVGLADGLGRVLAEDVAARLTQPPVAVSSMDGYAVRGADLAVVPVSLAVIGEAPAGGLFDGAVGPGQAVRIFTGGPLPDGADAVVMQEDTAREDDQVIVNAGVGPGNFIRPAGLDFAAGQVLLPAGRMLSPRDIGLAAAMNVPWLRVVRKPRVAILATGDELAMPGEPLGPSSIISSNSVALAAYVRTLGGVPVDLGIARDAPGAVESLVKGAAGVDVLVTLGGASVGDYDFVKRDLGRGGMELGFYKVAMRPGKPLIFGKLGDVPVLGLPGNPVSAGVTTAIFLRPAMHRMLGLAAGDDAPTSVLLGRDIRANDQRQDYLRATLSRDGGGELVATPFEQQDSAMLALFARADCLVVRPPHAPPAKAGDRVRIIPLGGGLATI